MSEKRYVRRRGGFSDRNNIKPISTVIQMDDFSEETRIVLKNKVLLLIDRYKESLGLTSLHFEPFIAKLFAVELFCLSLDSRESRYDNIISRLSSLFDNGDYDEILDAIEFVATNFGIEDENEYDFNDNHPLCDLKVEFNELFEEECLGYRFVDDYIEPITNSEEIKAIEESVNTKYDKVNAHMKKALEFLSSRENRNYKSVITECCHALECLLNLVLETKGLVLTDALKRYCSSNTRMHIALKESITKFYGYASDGAGLRHDTNNADYNEGFEEAKLILVNTSSLINYIISIS